MAERNCKKCFHYKACKEVASHSGYSDIYYTENQCKNFISADDVVKVIRCKDCGSYNKYYGECVLNGSHFGENGYCCRGTRTKERGERNDL